MEPYEHDPLAALGKSGDHLVDHLGGLSMGRYSMIMIGIRFATLP